MKRPLQLAIAIIIVACSGGARNAATPTAGSSASAASASSSPDASATGAAANPFRLTITESSYGSVAAVTVPGASCAVDVSAYVGQFGEGPPQSLAAQIAPASGVVRWSYSAPRTPKSTGVHWVSCQSGSSRSQESKGFDILARPAMVATAITVHVTTDRAPRDSARPDPSLVPLRDAAVTKMKATLATEWKRATRGLGSLELVEGSADITVFVVAAQGTSVNRSGSDGSEDIVIYVADRFGAETTENVVATTLHELGHIWCCTGADADGGGHWAQALRDPRLYGVDKYGLMTDPVTCQVFGTVVSCPNRFSDREMRALGFTTFPAPTPDPCVSQGLSLTAELKGVEAQVTSLKAQIESDQTRLAQLDAQMKALIAQYPNGLPPGPYAQYESLRAQYNSLVSASNVRVDQYNALADRDRALVKQVNALPCDWS